MGAGNAGSTGGGGGGVGPAGMTGTTTVAGKTKRTYGKTKDAQKTSERYEFRNRGATKLDNQKIIGSLALLKGPLKAGTKVNRDFFTDRVLGSKNFKGMSKKDFLNKTEMQQEMIYGDYMKGRQLGKTDAYGNTISQNNNDNNNQPVIVQKNVGGQTVQTTEAKVEEDKKEATQYDERVTKKKGRSKNILTSKQGVMKTSADYSLGKKSLLGQVV